MKIIGNETGQAIINELGNRIKQYRISLNITQKDLSEKCGVSHSTVARLENGADLKISNYIRILDGLGLLQNIDILVPEAQEDFKAIYEKKAPKQRVKQSKTKNKSGWVWGEDEV